MAALRIQSETDHVQVAGKDQHAIEMFTLTGDNRNRETDHLSVPREPCKEEPNHG